MVCSPFTGFKTYLELTKRGASAEYTFMTVVSLILKVIAVGILFPILMIIFMDVFSVFEQIVLWGYALGDLCFSIIKYTFPILFLSKS